MLRLSRLADYAVVIMSHMVAYDAPVHTATETATATSIPEPTVAKVMAKLARAGLLASQRGAKGGYALARKPDNISVADIVHAIDGPIALTHCVRVGGANCDVASNCPSSSGLNRINLAVRSALEAVSLENLALPFGPLGPRGGNRPAETAATVR